MRTPANIAKHPIHPMLVAIPIGLWIFSLVCDLVHRFGSANPNWEVVAWYTLTGGILGALIAAVPGFIDMLSLPWPTKRIALIHMSINLTVVALYVVNAYIRKRSGGAADAAIWLSVISVALLAVSGWLGGKMVYLHGVAVDAVPEQPEARQRPRYGAEPHPDSRPATLSASRDLYDNVEITTSSPSPLFSRPSSSPRHLCRCRRTRRRS
jgi:uncharacterized membrane protein